jgi:GTP-binding protein HflX
MPLGKVMFCRKQTFATLTTTVRKVVIKTLPFLLSDTVGLSETADTIGRFFQSTLDEVREADCCCTWLIFRILVEDHIASVKPDFMDIKANDKPVVWFSQD